MRQWALAYRSGRFADLKADALRIACDYRDLARSEAARLTADR
jgi:hypothetical protein